MKKVLSGLFALGFVIAFSSCQKKATCTSTDSITGVTITEDIKGSGHSYDNTLQTYEDNGWKCTEK